jgi:Domain of unknown function (DUF4357)
MSAIPKAVPHGFWIRLFLVDGRREGLWLVEKSNWSGVGLVWPRSAHSHARLRDELARAGVYVLVGPAESDPERRRVYVGEADVLRPRIDRHLADRDFWTRAIVFTRSDLNKAHVKYLESRLLTLARDAARDEIDNTNAPALPRLAEAEVADMDEFLGQMLTIFPILDVRSFEPLRAAGDGARLSLTGPGANARGQESPDGFVVFAASVARPDAVASIHPYLAALRETLQEQGVLRAEGEGLVFTKDYEFSSSSTAAGVVLGRAASGPKEWKDAAGRTLREIQRATIDASA